MRGIKAFAYRIDHTIGDGLERLTCSHHRRRLERIGWGAALEPPPGLWAEGNPPPRAGNDVQVLVDGAEAVPVIARDIEAATSHVHIAGWYLTAEFPVTRDQPPLLLRELLEKVAGRIPVRVLLWAGAPLPHLRRRVRSVGEELNRNGRIHFEVDAHARALHCHHEKTIVVDDRVAFVGGIDLTTRAGDRFDSSEHPRRDDVGWHDATARLRGPVVGDVADHFRMRWLEVTSQALPSPKRYEAAGKIEAQIVRTIPERVYRAVPRGDFRILESYARALRSAERFVYLENQFLWSPEIISILRAKLQQPPRDDFRLLLVLPAKASTGTDHTIGQLAVLAEADDDNGRMLACTIYARGPTDAEPVYVHAKIGVVDDHWLTVGSANLNEHSLFNDTEVNVVTRDPDLARGTRLRLWAEHLELPVERIDRDPVEIIDHSWGHIAAEQLRRREAGRQLTHRLVALPHVSKRSRRILGPFQSLFLDG
jgi:phosphatidylserine/phosphatidylglycerophosphate/cardiolipin synthase-like enzyme